MTAMQAAIGLRQLDLLPEWHEQRTRNAMSIFEAARGCAGLRVPEPPAEIEHGWYKCYVFVVEEALARGWNRDRIISEIADRGVPCFSGSCSEIYLEKAFVNAGIGPPERLPNAQKLGETSLMFLVHPTLERSEISRTCTALAEVMSMASG